MGSILQVETAEREVCTVGVRMKRRRGGRMENDTRVGRVGVVRGEGRGVRGTEDKGRRQATAGTVGGGLGYRC